MSLASAGTSVRSDRSVMSGPLRCPVVPLYLPAWACWLAVMRLNSPTRAVTSVGAVISATSAAAAPLAAALTSLRPFDHCLPFALQQGRRCRRGLRLSGSRGPDHRLGLGLELAPELNGRVQGGLQGGENDF